MQGQVNARTAAVAYLDSCMPIIIIPINTLADYVINVFVMWTILTGYQCAKSIIIGHNLLFLFPIIILIIIMADQVLVYECKENT